MRTIVHISDLHFGRTNAAIIDPLLRKIDQLKPDIVAVSGDLTQRARSAQFKEARRFLDAIAAPRIVVPGNHDVPLYNILARFGSPLKKYHRYVTRDIEPFFSDGAIAMLGINTARSRTFKHGRISAEQIARIRERFCRLNNGITKILVTHHPFDIPAGHDEDELVGRAKLAMSTLAECGADLLLSGHLHTTHTGHSSTRYKIDGYSALIVQAGTATSTRIRGEENSFNVLRVAHPNISVERHSWVEQSEEFVLADAEAFSHGEHGWAQRQTPVYSELARA